MPNKKWFLNSGSILDAKMRVICFPYAGGSAATYIRWLKDVPRGVEVVPVQLPGRSSRRGECPYTNMEELIHNLFSFFLDLTDKPYFLFGHSLGSRVAFELMCRCRAEGVRLPEHFIASGSCAPHIPSEKVGISKLCRSEFIEELRRFQGTPEEILQNKEMMDLSLPYLRADFELSETYLYESEGSIPFDCPITVFRGSEDDEVSLSDCYAWGEHFSREVDVCTLPGNHFFIESNYRTLLDKLNFIIHKSFI